MVSAQQGVIMLHGYCHVSAPGCQSMHASMIQATAGCMSTLQPRTAQVVGVQLQGLPAAEPARGPRA